MATDPDESANRFRGSALFRQDERGRTPLFDAAEEGLVQEVRDMISRLPGTGVYPQRRSLIELEDHDGLTAADIAERSGHPEIADLLRHELWRMGYFE